MQSHSNGRETASQLEQRLTDYGVLYHNARDSGFIVIGDEFIFIVNEHSNNPDDFTFRKIDFEKVSKFKVETGEPDQRYDGDNAEKITDGSGDGTKPITHIRLWLPSDAVDCYVDADPREVASAFVTFSLNDEDTTTNA